ncbi:bifunctional 2-polyprenyl-6-hydroxyphenol methylase/3-demethylubiquinol 3-O-methyltransferase UbiG [Kushneria phosphatilytica]|uniref:Ubiquinone biosynthesis O-methyltransferase n=1 Tax=Kushneria phosphatilytica TaxID=657387 RepID=A0A1S1NWK2_9GAMM|nr:bifunctional 2-polyprenyl-6-hydroxyphenol methylase/3-demethylubiquinol 3-O-methyltransferase UbiG [Kushneria phosphatilytica]OHV11942.1 bifunctional 3-demethylubiquinol 3-O-methyltransferase/2-polyprenyl-6-hydroxyphenol methylase [Kushneria phosphatilytica]QEL11123.1 bifunctional 2-polyprenyl-6-hydroxyphenol methylase/3-demethylubiquinol 3-O-methyltransferase UbiG [Kushneria phosphatilytica]
MPNVDQGEIAKFESLANHWWDREGEFKPLHDINPLRLDYIDEHAGLVGKKVIDIGCGGGILSEAMVHRGARVTGIDLGETPLAVARLHQQESGVDVDYQCISAEDMAHAHPGEFDIVTCMEMLEHVPRPESIVEACARLVKPGGHVFFSTINRCPKSWLLAIFGAEYVLKLLPRGTHEYKRFIRPSELARWARTSELQVRDITGMIYNPVTRHYRLSADDTDVNYLMHTRLDNA